MAGHDRRRAGFELGGQLGGREAVGPDAVDHAAAAEERRHGVEQFFAAVEHADAGGAEHLVAAEGEEVGAEFADVRGEVRHALGGVDEHERAGGVRAAGDFCDRVDRAQDVRDGGDGDDFRAVGEQRVERRRGSSRPSSVIGMCLRTAPVRSASCCQGTRFEWCSIVVTRISSPRLHVGVAPTAGDEVDAGGGAGREDDFAGVLGADEGADFFAGFFVLLGAAFAERVDAAVDVGVVALVDAASTSITCRGRCVLAALSRKTSG